MLNSESAFRKCYHAMTAWVREYLEPLALFFLRLVVAVPFWKSGMMKLNYWRNDQFDTLVYIFQDYRIPLIAPKIAAYLATAGEIILPVALVLGLLGRFAAIGLLIMTIVIYYVDQNSHAPYWAAILFLLAVRGAGVLCVDAIWKFLITPKKNYSPKN